MKRLFFALMLFSLAGMVTAKPRVVSVENGGLLFTDNQAGVSGTDAGFSYPIGPVTLWMFGDVFLLDPKKPEKPYVGGVSNCGLVVPKGHGTAPLRRYRFLTDPKTGLARPLIPNEVGEDVKTRLWPFGGWFDARHMRLYNFYADIKITGEGAFAFRSEGQGLAVADTRKPEQIRFRRLRHKGGELWWRVDGPVFGNAVIADGPDAGGWLYLVGSDGAGKDRNARLARVRRGRIEDPAAYEYLVSNGPAHPRWGKNRNAAAAVPGLSDFPSELSVSYNRYLGGYLAAHQVILAEKVRLSLAPHPWGPYRLIAEIGAPHQAFQKGNCYAGKEHPELAEDGGRVIYVTYVDQQRYWLQLLKVTLAR